jgi:hypothetical protein
MFVSCWSVKGGSGTTVVAVALALVQARSAPHGVLMVDLAGDVPAVLGMPEPTGPGVAEWLAAGPDVPPDGWARLEQAASQEVSVVPRGSGPLASLERAETLAGILAADHRPVVVDCGVLAGPDRGGGGPGGSGEVERLLAAQATHSLLVTRPCYLALRRAVAAPLHPSGILFVNEPGRSLDRRDVGSIVGAPVLAEVMHDPGVARAVDAGLLAGRLPRGLVRALRDVA